jgi:hypothetical protein
MNLLALNRIAHPANGSQCVTADFYGHVPLGHRDFPKDGLDVVLSAAARNLARSLGIHTGGTSQRPQ